MDNNRPLVPVAIGSKRHLDLIRAGYRTHHTDGAVTWLQHPKDVPSSALFALAPYDPDCPSCLRGLPHTKAVHDEKLRRAREASRA